MYTLLGRDKRRDSLFFRVLDLVCANYFLVKDIILLFLRLLMPLIGY